MLLNQGTKDDSQQIGSTCLAIARIFPATERSISQSETRRACCIGRGYPHAHRKGEDKDVVRDGKPDHEGSRWDAYGEQLTHHLVRVVVVVRISKGRDHVDA